MDILQIAEENLFISIGVILGIGLIQGAVLGRGIRQRFPKLKKHARIVSAFLLVLFTINAIANTFNFANPNKTSISEITFPETFDQGVHFLINVLGLNTGFGAVLALFVSITLILLFRNARLPKIARYFIFMLSIFMLCIAIVGRFTDYIPAFFEILVYAGYQFGITLGIFVVTYRKSNSLEEFDY